VSDWRRAAYRIVRPLLFAADPELIHGLALRMLASGVGRGLAPLAAGRGSDAPVDLQGLSFRNRVGLGAGFDKDGVAIRGWAALGLGFVELGTVTPRPQPGNPRPRLFRLAGDEALINRMGFNNAGADALARRIADARPHLPRGFVIGVNIGRNRDGDIGDYATAARSVAEVADYLAINVSSPNTPGLRDLQEPSTLRDLLSAVLDAAPGRPILVKLSPDLADADRAILLDAIGSHGAAGAILSNTSTERDRLRSATASEAGGLSGAPLRARTTAAVAQARSVVGDRLTIIGSGGISSGRDARSLLDAGADLVQLWTGMIFAGPALIGEAVRATQ
jgi:dihydroorotate dehydrogenase